MPGPGTPYAAEFRERFVALLRGGRSVDGLPRQFEPCAATIHGRIKQACRRARPSPFPLRLRRITKISSYVGGSHSHLVSLALGPDRRSGPVARRGTPEAAAAERATHHLSGGEDQLDRLVRRAPVAAAAGPLRRDLGNGVVLAHARSPARRPRTSPPRPGPGPMPAGRGGRPAPRLAPVSPASPPAVTWTA